jgi:hypothetical protein
MEEKRFTGPWNSWTEGFGQTPGVSSTGLSEPLVNEGTGTVLARAGFSKWLLINLRLVATFHACAPRHRGLREDSRQPLLQVRNTRFHNRGHNRPSANNDRPRLRLPSIPVRPPQEGQAWTSWIAAAAAVIAGRWESSAIDKDSRPCNYSTSAAWSRVLT